MKSILSVKEKSGLKLLNDRLTTLRPDPTGEITAAGKVMDEIKKELQQKTPFDYAEIKMVGSLKKNTMVTSRKEFDLVICLPQNLKNYPPKETTRKELQSKIAKFYGVEEPKNNQQNVIIKKVGWKIDLLPTFKIDINDFLAKNKAEKGVFKPYMSLLHLDFVSSRGQKYQELCRLAKFWTNGPEYIKDRHPYSSSWFIELIAAAVFDFSKGKWNLLELLEFFFRRVKNMKKKKFYMAFSDYYDKNKYRKKWEGKLTVLEPTDPYDNLANRGAQKENLGELVKRAKNTLNIWKENGFNQVFQTYFSRRPI